MPPVSQPASETGGFYASDCTVLALGWNSEGRQPSSKSETCRPEPACPREQPARAVRSMSETARERRCPERLAPRTGWRQAARLPSLSLPLPRHFCTVPSNQRSMRDLQTLGSEGASKEPAIPHLYKLTMKNVSSGDSGDVFGLL